MQKKITSLLLSSLSLSLYLSLSPNRAAHSAEPLTELDFLSDAPVSVTSATRLKQEIRDIPAAITIIDREMIEASSAINVIELLRLVPGFQVGSIDGTESTATYHGLSSQQNVRLQIQIDGRSVYQSTLGGALWYTLPITLDEIERIEVLRGPNAASYGANAFSGVVNIKTFHSNAEGHRTISYLGGERDTRRSKISWSDQLENTSYRVVVENESNTGMQKAFQNEDRVNELNDDHIHNQITLRVDHDNDDGSLLFLQAGYRDLEFGGGFEDLEELAPFNKDVKSHFINVAWEDQVSLLKTRKLQFYHNYIDYNAQLFSNPAPGDELTLATLDYDFRDKRWDLEYQETQIWSPTLQTVWGTGIRYDTTDSIGWLKDDRHDRLSLRLFGHVEYKPQTNLTLNAGAFIESHEHIGEYLSPRLAANYHLAPGHTLRTSISRAYRMPEFYAEDADQSIFSVFFFPLSDPQTFGFVDDLDPEEMTSLEIGYLGSFFNNRLNLDLRLAREEIRDIIDRRPTDRDDTFPPADYRFYFNNYGEVDINSLEAQITYRPSGKSFLKLDASWADADGFVASKYSVTDARALGNREIDKNVPGLTAGLLFAYKFPDNLTTSLQYNFVEGYKTEGEGDELDDFESIDIKLSKQLKLEKTTLDIDLIIRNIADDEYQDFQQDNLVGRLTYLQLKLGLD